MLAALLMWNGCFFTAKYYLVRIAKTIYRNNFTVLLARSGNENVYIGLCCQKSTLYQTPIRSETDLSND